MRNDNLSRVITQVNTKFGAPTGRANVGKYPMTIISGNNGRIFKKDQTTVYNKRVRLIDGYDAGGAYWGSTPGYELRVEFTADLSYINFFRCPS